MLSIAQVKVGMYLKVRDEPFRVVFAQHTKMGRGGGVLKMKAKNLISGAIVEMSFRDSDRLEAADLSREPAQFLYRDGESFNFMNNTSYEQFALSRELIGESANWLKDDSLVDVLYFDRRPLGVNLAAKVDLAITYTEPAVAGNTVSNVMKNATVETGAIIKVPLFAKTGDVVRINTETGDYVERVPRLNRL